MNITCDSVSKISTEIFLKSFEISLERYDSRDIMISYQNSTLWTKFMEKIYLDIEENLRAQTNSIVDSSKINLYREYHNIDATYWLENETYKEDIASALVALDIRDANNQKIWKFMLAIEHENDSRGWFYELNQLMNFNCPLKVLISYAKDLDTNSGLYHDLILKVLNKVSVHSNPLPGEEFVILLGNNANKLTKLKELQYYIFSYKYNDEKKIYEALIKEKVLTRNLKAE